MKVVLRVLFLVILLLVAIPSAIVGAALINDAPVPTYLLNFNAEEFNAEEEMNTKLNYVMMSNVLGHKNIQVDEEFVAKFLFTSMDGFKSLQSQMGEGYSAGVEFVWFTFDDNILSLYGTVKLNQIRTTFTAKLEFKDFAGYTEVRLHTLKIGKLPLPKALVIWGIKQIEDDEQALKTINPYGQFKLDDLTMTIEDEYINNMFKNMLKSDLITFKSIVFDNQDITLNYEFSALPEAVAIDKALTEFKDLITSSEKRTNIDTQLEQLKSSGTIDDATKSSIDSVLNMLESKTDPNTDFTFTDEDMQKINDLTSNFSNLTPEQASQISQVFIDNMDEATLKEIEAELAKSDGNKDITQIINEFLGKK